ncbi:MAG: tape measure protein [Rhodoferax sp.]|uniref:tape measure protein n=1 Tax=Rhodoferax sp. TaxID=50421 RepID=UPI003BB4EB17
MASNKLEIEIAAIDKAGPVIKGVASDVAAIAPAADKAQDSADGALTSMTQGGTKAADATQSISDQLALVQKAYVGLQAVQGAINMVKGITETADAYNNLGARIKLATGDGAAFSSAMAGISAVAQRTSTGLEATGTLFTKLAQAGKEMGVGQAEALKLTETVNQAIQLSGASASASDAAVTQLVQGLQGGVLRGDEFNSVMEQAPRLAKALADGLGVTTGELRKMAEAGQLSSETVIKALQGQSDVVASEFGKLPDTVGRALTQLDNAWTQYVGETDKATGASTLAAQAIGQLAKNLPAIAGFLIDAGQAAGAFAAIKLGQHFLSIASGATAATGAMVGATGAMGASTVAAGIAARAVAMLSVALRAIPLFGLMALVANLKDVGTWLGETAAKAMGYRDRSKEMAAADQAAAAASAKHAEALKRKNVDLEIANERLTGYSDLVQKQVDRINLSVQALTSEAKSRRDLAQLTGDETEIRKANAAAAELENQAARKGLQTAEIELKFLRETLIEKTSVLAAQGKISAANQTELGEMSKLLGERQQTVDKMRAQASASELLAAKTKLEVDTNKDNSARLGDLKSAYEAVTREVDALRRKKEQGQPVDDALSAKLLQQATALGLYRDAAKDAAAAAQKLAESQKFLADNAGKIEAAQTTLNDAINTGTSVLSASAQAAISSAKGKLDNATASYEAAKASGDEEKAAQLLVEVKKFELELAKANAAAKREEAEGAKLVAAAKQQEAQIAIETAKRLQEELAKATEVTAAMRAMAAEASMNAIAKAGAAKEALAHANAMDAEASAAERAVTAATTNLGAAEAAMARVTSTAGGAASSVNGLGLAIGSMGSNARDAADAANRAMAALSQAGNTTNELAFAAGAAGGAIHYFGEQKLQPLLSALDSAKQRMVDMKASAQDTLNAINDELDDLNKNYDDIEKRRFAQRKADLEAKRDMAKFEGNNQAVAIYTEALSKLEQIAPRKIAEATQRETEARNQELAKARDGTDAYGQPLKSTNSTNAVTAPITYKAEKTTSNEQASTPDNAAKTVKTVNINLSINNSNIGTVDTSPAGSAVMQSFIDALQRSKLSAGS